MWIEKVMSPLLILSLSKSENVWTSQRNVLGIQRQDPHQCERFPACGSRSAGPHAPRPRQCAALFRLRRNRRHFADIFKCIFLNENVLNSIKISLKFIPKGPINNIPALVQIMAWRRPGNKPLSEPMMVSLLTHICVTRPQWVNTSLKDWVRSN